MSDWKLTWLGHAGFRIETGGAVLLVDPWLRGNPSFDETRFDEAIADATHILLTHGHADHAGDAAEIAHATGAAVVGIVELIGLLGAENAVPMNKGGTVALGGEVAATMVHALHSSSFNDPSGARYAGDPAGYMIRSGAQTLYVMGDTDVFSDMALLQELHAPQFGVLPIGGHFTMDSRRAAYACKKFFSFNTVVPCHFGTFPVLEPTADAFAAAMEGAATVIAPQVMTPIEL